MPRARLIFDGDWVYTEKEARIHKLTQDAENKIESIPGVIDNVNSTSTTDALSANMGKALQDQINNLAWMGTFLSNWDCTTGLPETEPTQDPYTYKAWNYYIVSKVSDILWGNKRPHWSQYNHWVPSTTIETGEIHMNDWYIYDWIQWLIQPAWDRTITIDDMLKPDSRNPVENRAVYSALSQKQDEIFDLGTIREWAAAWATAIQPEDNITKLTNNIGYQTAGDVASAINDAIEWSKYVWPTAPSLATEWMLWYDTTNDILKVYDWTNWNPVDTDTTYTNWTYLTLNWTTFDVDTNTIATKTYVDTQVAESISSWSIAPQNPTEWQLWYDTVNHILNIYNWTSWVPVDTNTTYSAWTYLTLTWTTFDVNINTIATKNYVDTSFTSKISNAGYSGNWSWVTDVAPSKNVVYNKIESLKEFTPESAWNTEDILEKTATWYDWTWLKTINWQKITGTWDINTSWWIAWYWDSALVWLFANANWWNFWLLNSQAQYATNSTYEANRADNTKTWNWALEITVSSPTALSSIDSIKRYNVYYNIWWLSNSTTWAIRPSWSISDQVKTDIIPMYWTTTNYTVYDYRATSSVPDEHVYIASINKQWTHINEYKIDGAYDSTTKTNYWFWLWADRSEYCYFYPNTSTGSVDRAVFSLDVQSSSWQRWFAPFAVGNNWRYIYYIKDWSSAWWSPSNLWVINLWVFDTSAKTDDFNVWNSQDVWWNRAWKWYQVWNDIRIYFYKYFGSNPATDYQWWYFKLATNTKAVTSVTNMTYEEVTEFLNNHPCWVYDNFTNWNLLINCEETADWYAYFNWEKVWKGYFTRWRDNNKKEYWYSWANLILFSWTDWYINLEVWWNVVEKWQANWKWWWMMPDLTSPKKYSSSTPITTSNASISLKAKWLWSWWSITLQPTSNNLQDVAQFRMRWTGSLDESTWMEIWTSWLDSSHWDVLAVAWDLRQNTSINIIWDITRYNKVAIYRSVHALTYELWYIDEIFPYYMPDGAYHIAIDISDNSHCSVISADRKTYSSDCATTWTLIIWYN